MNSIANLFFASKPTSFLTDEQVEITLKPITLFFQNNILSTWPTSYSLCLITFLSSIFFHTFLYYIFSPMITKLLFSNKFYENLKRDIQIEWNSRIVSNIHAMLYITFSVISIFFENAFPTNSIDEKTNFSRIAVVYAAGYFFYDLILVFKHPKLGGIPMLLHHGFVLFGILNMWICDQYWVVLCYYSLLELSTPFVNLRWFLWTCHLKDSIYYTLNGFLMWLVFGLCRMPFVVFGPYLIYINHSRLSYYFGFILYINIVNITLLNVYWYTLMTKKIVEALGAMMFGSEKNLDSKDKAKGKVEKMD
ncbi:hypothetical protein ABK040_011110 [Willaertia magna]